MSNQHKVNFEGGTFKVTAQVVNMTYTGVSIIDSKGNGILGNMMAGLSSVKSDPHQESTETTKSSEVGKFTFDDIENGSTSHFADVRAGILALHPELNAKVKIFHERLTSLKEDLLGGAQSRDLDHDDLSRVRDAMRPYNLGKVVKVRLLARLFSNKPVAGWHSNKSGGYSRTGCLYTMYIPYTEGMDLEAEAARISNMFASGTTPDGVEIETFAMSAKVFRKDNGKIAIKPIPPQQAIVAKDEKGGAIITPIEDIKSARGALSMSSLFTKK